MKYRLSLTDVNTRRFVDIPITRALTVNDLFILVKYFELKHGYSPDFDIDDELDMTNCLYVAETFNSKDLKYQRAKA
jgi:hypothetical protein